MTAWLGIDLGTQGARVIVADETGRSLAVGATPLASHRVGERHEQHPDAWWAAVLAALRQADGAGGLLAQVDGIAVTATSGTVTLLGADGEATGPALMYDDARARTEVATVNAVGAAQWVDSGYQRMQRSWGLPKLLWLLAHHRDGSGLRLAHQNDVVNRRLVGHDVSTDTSNALKTGVDAARVAWPTAVMTALGVPSGLLPDVVLPGTILGQVCSSAAAETGLRTGTPVVAGMTDGCAAQLGSGASEVGSWNSVLGTTLVLKGVTSQRLADPGGVVYSHRAADGNWLPGGASSVGAGLVAREFGDDVNDLDRLTLAAEKLLPTDLVRYPLGSAGERFPFVAPGATGFASRAASGPAEAFAALLQGTAYVERLCFDYLDLLGAPSRGRLVMTGGATRNDTWTQLRADVLGRMVELPANAQPALGMAVLAAAGVSGDRAANGTLDLAPTTAAMVRIERTVLPRDDHHDAHAGGYLRLVAQLADRGWLPTRVAHHAQERTHR